MNWYDVEDILYEGTVEQIEAVRCPECEGLLRTSYSPATRNVEIRCMDCHTVVRAHGVKKIPNFASLCATT